ncbi:MAG TPA: efflux RND transporter periplasmic adaptor subunit [Armatimonadota bacterium]|nr:efflux RND transporter periplasmic adaptor subunit [Armatimonadota bacterium]
MRTKRRPTRWIIAIAVIAVVAGFFIVKARQQGKPEPIISTATVFRGTVTSSVSGNGILQPVTTVEVKSNVGGQIVELAVDEGDLVRAGQLIARIDPADALSALEQMEADLTGATARVHSSRESLELQRRQQVTNVAAAEQAVASARARLAQAEKLADMQTTTSESAVQQATESLAAARARLAQAEAQAAAQPRLTATAIKQAESSLAAARSALQQTKTALAPQKIAAAQASFDQAQANYAHAETNLARQQQLLAKGYVPRSQVDTAQQSFAVAKAQLATARQKLDTVKDEAREDIQAAQARVDQAEAALASAQANGMQDDLKRQDATAARAAVKQAEANLAAAQAGKGQDTVKVQDIAAARAALKQAEANLASARASAHQVQIRREEITQAEASRARTAASVANARTQVSYSTITAPRDGVVVKKYVEVGSIVTAGRSSLGGSGAGVGLVDIADVTKMRIQVDVDETDIGKIRVGQNVDITVDAYPDELFSGLVTKIAPQATTTQTVTTIPVTVQLDWTDRRLKPGMNATCDFITERHTDALLVPSEAVNETDSGATVTVMVDGKRVTRSVRVGIVGVDNTEILEGVSAGESVVTAITEPSASSGRRTRGILGGGGGRRR